MDYADRLMAFNSGERYKRECELLYGNMLPVEGKVLDVGCGIGGIFNFLTEKGFDVYGVDPNKTLVKILSSPRTQYGIAEDLPFNSESFSIVYFMHSFAHLNDAAESLSEAKRVLIPGGRLYIITPNADFENLISPAKWALSILGLYEFDPTVRRHYSKNGLWKIIAKEFEVFNVEHFGLFKKQSLLCKATKK